MAAGSRRRCRCRCGSWCRRRVIVVVVVVAVVVVVVVDVEIRRFCWLRLSTREVRLNVSNNPETNVAAT